MPQVIVFLGSASDLDTVKQSGMAKIFDDVEVSCKAHVVSAHRNADVLAEQVRTECQDGAKVFIGVAGMAAALPGAIAGATMMAKPVIGVPLDEHGIDSCLYMPPGVPAPPAGVGKTGLKNAALYACQILATGDHDLELRLMEYVSRTNKQPQFGIDLSTG